MANLNESGTDIEYIKALGRVHAIVEFKPDGTILNANTNFLNLVGYSLNEVQGQHHRLLCDPNYVSSVAYREFWDKLGRGEYEQGSFKRFAKGNRELWLSASYNPVFDADGKVIKIVKFATDGTQNKLAAAEYESVVNAINRVQAIIEFDLTGKILNANKNFLNAIGYTLDEVKGKHHSMFCDKEYVKTAEYKLFWEKFALGEYDSGEYKRYGKYGREVWINASYNPIFNMNVQPIKVMKFATEVTQQILCNAEQNGKLSAISRSQAVAEFSMDGTIITANQIFLDLMGYSAKEVVGHHHRMFCDDTYAKSKEYADFWDKLNRGEYEAKEYKRFGKGSKEVWIQATYNPIFDINNKPFKVVKFATDVSADKLRNAELSGKIDAICKSQAVIEFDLKGNILDANENFLQASGYEKDEIIGKHHRMFCEPSLIKSEEYLQFWKQLNAGQFLQGVYKRINKAGQEIWLNASYNPIMDLNGKPFKVVKYATDVTKIKLKNAEYEGKVNGISRAQAVIEFDLNGIILAANDNFLNLFLYSTNELVGKHHRMLCDEKYAESRDYKEFWENLNRGEFDSGRYDRYDKKHKKFGFKPLTIPSTT